MTNIILILLLNWGPGPFYCESHPSDTTRVQTEYVPIEVASFSTVCKSSSTNNAAYRLGAMLDHNPATTPRVPPRVITRFTIEPRIRAERPPKPLKSRNPAPA